ncbi:DUF3309 family protein [bacterium]|nr:DUF3309 family protein [bacterium]
MSLGMILLVALVILALGGLPRWGFHRYGYGPSGLFGIVVLVLLVMLMTGRL